MNLTIVYMVAGLSSRFGGKIKAFAEIGPNNETLIEISLNQAIKSGFNKIIFVVSRHTEKPFKKKFGDSYKGIPIQYTLQEFDKEKRDRPWGTCDAVCSAINLINEPFVIATGDDIYGEKTFEILTEHLKNNPEDATATKKLIDMLPKQGAVNRGIFKTDKNNFITDGVENLGISKENFSERGFTENSPASISIFGLRLETLKPLKEKLKKFKEENSQDRKIECFLNEKLIELTKENKIKIKNYFTPEKWLGITNPEDEIKIKQELKK